MVHRVLTQGQLWHWHTHAGAGKKHQHTFLWMSQDITMYGGKHTIWLYYWRRQRCWLKQGHSWCKKKVLQQYHKTVGNGLQTEKYFSCVRYWTHSPYTTGFLLLCEWRVNICWIWVISGVNRYALLKETCIETDNTLYKKSIVREENYVSGY